jgi:hypothetical protein
MLSCSAKAENLVNRSSFFEYVMGVTEPTFQQSKRHNDFISWNETEQSFFLRNQKTKEQFRAGKFSIISIKELREKTGSLRSVTRGTFNVIEALSPIGQEYYRYVDIGAMQADPKNRDAVFQVASNFNCLELVSPHDAVDGITKYVHDLTQGPFASISAAPGLILRHYYAFYNPLTSQEEWQQYAEVGGVMDNKNHKLKQINLLERTAIPVTNSYVNFNVSSS